MSTINGAIGAALHRPTTEQVRSHYQRIRIGKDGTKIRMNAAAHQKKENEQTGKREAGEEKKQLTNFKETICWPSAVGQRAAWQKNGLHKELPGDSDPRKGQQSF